MSHYSDRSAAVALAESLHRIRKLARNGTGNLSRYEDQLLDEEVADFRDALHWFLDSDDDTEESA